MHTSQRRAHSLPQARMQVLNSHTSLSDPRLRSRFSTVPRQATQRSRLLRSRLRPRRVMTLGVCLAGWICCLPISKQGLENIQPRHLVHLVMVTLLLRKNPRTCTLSTTANSKKRKLLVATVADDSDGTPTLATVSSPMIHGLFRPSRTKYHSNRTILGQSSKPMLLHNPKLQSKITLSQPLLFILRILTSSSSSPISRSRSSSTISRSSSNSSRNISHSHSTSPSSNSIMAQATARQDKRRTRMLSRSLCSSNMAPATMALVFPRSSSSMLLSSHSTSKRLFRTRTNS